MKVCKSCKFVKIVGNSKFENIVYLDLYGLWVENCRDCWLKYVGMFDTFCYLSILEASIVFCFLW